MAENLSNIDLAMELHGRIRNGTFDQALFNGILKSSHAEIVIRPQPLPVYQLQASAPQYHSPWAQPSASSAPRSCAFPQQSTHPAPTYAPWTPSFASSTRHPGPSHQPFSSPAQQSHLPTQPLAAQDPRSHPQAQQMLFPAQLPNPTAQPVASAVQSSPSSAQLAVSPAQSSYQPTRPVVFPAQLSSPSNQPSTSEANFSDRWSPINEDHDHPNPTAGSVSHLGSVDISSASSHNTSHPASNFTVQPSQSQKRKRQRSMNLASTAEPNEPGAGNTDSQFMEIVNGKEWQLAREHFLQKWEPLAYEQTKVHGAVARLCMHDDLPPRPTSRYKAESAGYCALDNLMTAIDTWGRPQVEEHLLSVLGAVPSSHQKQRPSLTLPVELETFDQSSRACLYNLWRAARLADFWDRYQSKYKVVWRMAIFKEVRLFHEAVATLTKSSRAKIAKAQVYEMYDIFNASESNACRLKHKCSNTVVPHGSYAYLYRALYHTFHSDGIVAMIPDNFAASFYCSTKRIDVIVEALKLLKPRFQDVGYLEICSRYIDKVYEGHALTGQDLDRLGHHLQVVQDRPTLVLREPTTSHELARLLQPIERRDRTAKGCSSVQGSMSYMPSNSPSTVADAHDHHGWPEASNPAGNQKPNEHAREPTELSPVLGEEAYESVGRTEGEPAYNMEDGIGDGTEDGIAGETDLPPPTPTTSSSPILGKGKAKEVLRAAAPNPHKNAHFNQKPARFYNHKAVEQWFTPRNAKSATVYSEKHLRGQNPWFRSPYGKGPLSQLSESDYQEEDQDEEEEE
ncbi:MAG: hypothetical protein Q9169_004271 [Polycauliona sp. 2 TL-2023]